jgi:hypothetical protein
MSRINLGELINSKHDLPKVTLIFVIVLATCSTILLCDWDWVPQLPTFLFGIGSMLCAWHVKKAYLDEGDWRGLSAVAGIATFVFVPVTLGWLVGRANPSANSIHLTVGILWTGVFLAVALCLLWMRACIALSKALNQIQQRGEFLQDVGIERAWVADRAPGAHKAKTQNRTAELMQSNLSALRILVINGYDDLVDEASPIAKALHSHIAQCRADPKIGAEREGFGVRVLLLDPFSTFAKDRAMNLAGSWSTEWAMKRYVRHFDLARKRLAKLGIEHRIYCSRPLFRFYLGTCVSGDQWCVEQSYLRNKHGYETPVFEHVINGNVLPEDSFITLAGQAFEYMWDRSFKDYTEQGLMDSALVVYMAEMYGLIRGSLMDNAALTTEQARKLVIDFTTKAFADVANTSSRELSA